MTEKIETVDGKKAPARASVGELAPARPARKEGAAAADAPCEGRALAPCSPASPSMAFALPALNDFAAFARFAKAQPELDEAQEAELARDWRERGSLRAAHRLVLSQLRLVARIVREHRGYGMPAEDLAQEGSIGLMKAVKRFDPEKGARLAPYAAIWIRSEIQRHILENWRLVKIGSTKALKKLFFGWRSAQARLSAEGGREALGQEAREAIAKELGVKPEEARAAQEWFASAPLSLDAPPPGAEGEAARWEIADEAPTPEGALMRAESRQAAPLLAKKAFAALNERERLVAGERLLREPPKTLAELGADLGVSVERVRQIEAAALKKMRKALLDEPEAQAIDWASMGEG
jgi:RNA polymerase sigma-32 factor